MKKLFLFIVLVALFAQVRVLRAQDESCKGYIGLTVGPAFMTGELKDFFNTGVEFSVNFGYLFIPHVGIQSSIFGTSFPVKENSSTTLGLTGLLVGPLFSTATTTGKIEFDFRPAIGFASGSATMNEQSTTTKSTTLALGLGGSLRWNCWRRISLSANLDYYYGKPKDDSAQKVEMDLSSFGISVGINYRFGISKK